MEVMVSIKKHAKAAALCMHCYISGTEQSIIHEHLILNIQVLVM
jgi:hypothetical protein